MLILCVVESNNIVFYLGFLYIDSTNMPTENIQLLHSFPVSLNKQNRQTSHSSSNQCQQAGVDIGCSTDTPT